MGVKPPIYDPGQPGTHPNRLPVWAEGTTLPEVAAEAAVESQADDASEESVETPATPTVDEATWKKRVAGKDQALTEAKKQAAALQKQLDDIARWKAEREQADLTEVEKLQRQVAEFEARTKQAEAAANAARLAREYPLAADLLGEDLGLFDPTKVAEINGRLAKEQGAESEPEPRMDPNQPRRNAPKPAPSSLKDSMAALEALGNPFFDPDAV